MTKIITINQLIKMFEDFSEEHLQLNDFGYGPTSEIGASRSMIMPYLWITHTQGSGIIISNRTQTPELNLNFIIVDQINNQDNYLDTNGNNSNNIQEIMSDTFQIVQDLIGYIMIELGKNGVMLIDETAIVNPVMDETQDRVSGWSVDLTLKMNYMNCIRPKK